MALETFDGKKTGWEGLWYQPDAHIYTSILNDWQKEQEGERWMT